jgi:transposase
MELRLAELEDRLRANSSNSSKAPSSDPAWAPKVNGKKPSGKKPGGQKGHEGHHRTLLPVEDVDEVVRHRLQVCPYCQAALVEREMQLLSRHQVAELPQRAVKITEHQSYGCRCGRCGKPSIAPIPAEVKGRCTGERLSAALCFLSAYVHGSRRAVEEVAQEMLGCELSLGTVMNREAEMSEALEPAYLEVQEQVRRAPAKNVDETGWKRAGRWLWVAATKTAALFHIDRGRNWHGLQNLLGQWVTGTVCSDRHGLYEHLKIGRRGICWAHLKRDFQRWLERAGASKRLGTEGLAITGQVFVLWRQFQNRHLSRRQLRTRILPLRRRMRKLLAWGMDCGVKKARYFCRNVLKVQRALWTFARVAGIEPTNNHAERMLRPGVIWRKKSFGSHSAQGCRFAERMMTVIQTLRLKGRSVMDFLADTLHAHRNDLPLLSITSSQRD